MLGSIPGKAFNQTTQNQVTVLGHNHIDKINHDHATNIAQTQLADNLFRRLQITLGDRCFQRLPLANKAAGIHIDRGHSLCSVHNQRTAGGKVNLPLHSLPQL